MASGAEMAISRAKAWASSRSDSSGHQLVAQALGEGLLAVDPPARVEHVERHLLADERRQRRRQPEALVEAEAGEVGREAGLGRGDPEVGEAGRRPGRRRSPRPARRPPPACGWRTAARPRGRATPGAGLGLAGAGEVGPGAERLAVGAQHRSPGRRRPRRGRRRRRPSTGSACGRSSCAAAGRSRRWRRSRRRSSR